MILRRLADADLDALFEWEREPGAVQMAAFTRPDPSDRASFDAHYQRSRRDPSVRLRAVDDGGGLVGTVASFMMDGHREICYWIDPARWGEGLASAALGEFLRIETARPLFARVAEHNTGSATVLARAGFTQIGFETSFADGIGRDVVECIYELGR
ncbi:MAG: GNAT family N-acetyltransferase [Geodermatophilaceae bacterium]